jgi:hypothetical protein
MKYPLYEMFEALVIRVAWIPSSFFEGVDFQSARR